MWPEPLFPVTSELVPFLVPPVAFIPHQLNGIFATVPMDETKNGASVFMAERVEINDKEGLEVGLGVPGETVTLPKEAGTWPQYLRKRLPMIIRMSVIYLAVLNVGFDLSVANTTLGMASFRKYFGHEVKPGKYEISSVYQAGWTGGTAAGQVVMDLPGGWLADRYGRKFTLILSVLVIVVASTVQVTAHSIGQVIAGKVIFGMGSGLYISFCTSYTAELAAPRLRGLACMAVNFCIQGGMWVGSGAALGMTLRFPDVDDSRSFRYVFAMQYLFAGLFLLACRWLPESPVFYVHREHLDKAEAIVASLYESEYDVQRHVAFLVHTDRVERAARQAGKAIGYRELLKGRNLLRASIAACIVMPLFMGTAFWPNYQTYYFAAAGVANPQAMNYGATSVAIGTSVLAALLIERVGRRKLWLLGATGMTMSNLVGGLMWIPWSRGHKLVAGRVATASVFIWNGLLRHRPRKHGLRHHLRGTFQPHASPHKCRRPRRQPSVQSGSVLRRPVLVQQRLSLARPRPSRRLRLGRLWMSRHCLGILFYSQPGRF